MNIHAICRGVRIVVAGLSLAVVGAAAQAQTRHERKDLGDLQFDTARLKPLRAERQFQALTREDVERSIGEKVPVGAKVKLTDGSTIPFEDALQRVNDIEAKLAKDGASLREASREIRVRRFSREDTTFANQARSLADSVIKDTAPATSRLRKRQETLLPSPLRLAEIGSENKKIVARTATAGYAKQSVSEVKEWKKDLGDPQVFAVTLGASFAAEGDATRTKLKGKSNAGLTIVNKYVDVLTAEGSFDAPASGEQKVQLRLALAGNTLLSIDEKYDSWSKARSWSKTMEVSGALTFPLVLGIKAKVKTGVEGTLALGYEASVATLYASARFDVDADLDAFAELSVVAGIDKIVSVEVGVRGELTILSEDLEAVGKAQANIANTDLSKWSLDIELYAHQRLEALSGELLWFVDLDLPWPLNKYDKRFSDEIFSFDGFELSGYLFQVKKSYPLYLKS